VSDETSIEIPELAGLGRDVTALGERFGHAVAGIDGWAHSARGLVDGSVLCESQIDQSAEQWRATLTLLADSIENFGRSLSQAAADYRSTDAAAARRVRAAGELPR
jgi:hypothetical protein